MTAAAVRARHRQRPLHRRILARWRAWRQEQTRRQTQAQHRAPEFVEIHHEPAVPAAVLPCEPLYPTPDDDGRFGDHLLGGQYGDWGTGSFKAFVEEVSQ